MTTRGCSRKNQPETSEVSKTSEVLRTEADYKVRAAAVYAEYAGPTNGGSNGCRLALFIKLLAEDLRSDIQTLLKVLKACGEWDPSKDAKLDSLWQVLTKTHPEREGAAVHQ